MSSQGLGDLEQLVILAVVRLGNDAYAVSVRNEIEQRTERSITRGAVYVTLDRMERKGYLRSSMSEPSNKRGGKAKRIFHPEAKGVTALQASLDGIWKMMDGVTDKIAWSPGG